MQEVMRPILNFVVIMDNSQIVQRFKDRFALWHWYALSSTHRQSILSNLVLQDLKVAMYIL